MQVHVKRRDPLTSSTDYGGQWALYSLDLQIIKSSENANLSFHPIWPGHFWSSCVWGGGFKSPLHKSESIDAIDMKLGGLVGNY